MESAKGDFRSPTPTGHYNGMIPTSPVRPDTPGMHLPGQVPGKSVPGKSPSRSPAGGHSGWNDVLDICKKGFANKMNSLGEEILQDVRVEVKQAAINLRREIADMFEAREIPLNLKLSQLFEKLEKGTDFSKVSLAPIFDKMQSRDVSGGFEGDMTHTEELLQRMEERLVEISEGMQKAHEADAGKVHRLEERLQNSETQLAQLSESQKTSSASADLIVQELQKVRSLSQEDNKILLHLESQLASKGQDTTMGATFIKEVISQVKRTEDAMNADFGIVLGEIGKIQKGMHLEFAQIHEHQEKMDVMSDGASEAADGTASMASNAVGGRRPSINSNVPGLKVRKRVREHFSQTDMNDQKDNWTQTDPKIERRKIKTKPQSREMSVGSRKSAVDVGPEKKAAFGDPAALRAQARQALIRPQYNVFDLYHDTGVIQLIAKSRRFENATICMVLLNAIWMAIDTDYNHAALITDASPTFVVADNIFCLYFFTEVSIRFLAFRYKKDSFMDAWFVFDFLLVAQMVVETWFVTIIMVLLGLRTLPSTVDMSMLRIVRMVKIVRLTRMAKLLRAMPELTIIVKGIGYAARSVAVFLILWIILIFVFAVVLRQLTAGSEIGDRYFESVPASMNTLFLEGIFPDTAHFVHDLHSGNKILWPFIVIFLLLASVTVMYMLVGVLVGVIHTARAQAEHICLPVLGAASHIVSSRDCISLLM
ncbi:unnamed protein product [Polarella glacialis]|uniref:Ion transport domain-containing protein n=1 Tax=Polarella glacialis TaxID=89957 RepID=A0A813JN61_POLGL|nr:unnamed protein product [Polarella glacialis]CAE8685536.1 unnamed protein product [Polarella glacialis]